jgi:hypothetical protein
MERGKQNVEGAVTTPKLANQLQEVHNTTILEENETMRGSIERGPGALKNMG